jgi:phenylacetic acid degradation protein PaaD
MQTVNDAVERVRRLAARDRFMQMLGVQLHDCGPGRAVVRAQVSEDYLNFNGTCHGGFVFTLADCSFGLASNSHGTIAAGIDAHIAYSAPARLGDVLIATAQEETRSQSLATYRIKVTRERDRRVIALFTGTVFRSDQSHD